MDNMPVERAAGGLVVRLREGRREVLLIDDAYGKVAFPKGHVESGETWEQAAVREILEETGVEARILSPLGRVEYLIDRHDQEIRKQVRLFLLEAIDELDEPIAQEEEVNGAYFAQWDDAVTLQHTKGYHNWTWVYEKAAALLEWHDLDLEDRWRQAQPEKSVAELTHLWLEAKPVLERLNQSVLAEMRAVAPNMVSEFQMAESPAFPVEIADAKQALREAVEHTLLRPEASVLDVMKLCHEAIAHDLPRICIHPQHIHMAKHTFADAAVHRGICTVLAFPLGSTDINTIKGETRHALDAGATELDMVIPIGSMCEDDVWTVYEYVKQVAITMREVGATKTLKVILETHYLAIDQLIKAAIVSIAAGADFLKTSSGFAPSGARIADVALLTWLGGQKVGVKAAGGIRTMQSALNFMHFGATRIGTSSSLQLIRQ